MSIVGPETAEERLARQRAEYHALPSRRDLALAASLQEKAERKAERAAEREVRRLEKQAMLEAARRKFETSYQAAVRKNNPRSRYDEDSTFTLRNSVEIAIVQAWILNEDFSNVAKRMHYSDSMISMSAQRMRQRFGCETNYQLIIRLVKMGIIE